MAHLIVQDGTKPQLRFELDGDRSIVGRHPDCDLVIESALVSRRHFQIIREGAQYYVEDLGSRLGLFLNDEPLKVRQLLEHGDLLRAGDTVFRFERLYASPASDAMQFEERP